jgi:uncharacterized alkaline shock family protein YloU
MVDQVPPGSVRVANEVIASIASMAAREIDGVSGLDDASARHFGDWIKRETAHRGVRVVLDPQRKIHLEVFLTVTATAILRDVAERVQDNVVEAVERMLGLKVAEVNVFVSSIAFASYIHGGSPPPRARACAEGALPVGARLRRPRRGHRLPRVRG